MSNTDEQIDEMVYKTQKWLNETYGGDSRFNKLDLENKKIKGKTGWPTIYALTRALQIELGITNTADNFGPTTQSLFKTVKMQTKPSPENNINAIIQGALWCKGYSTGSYEITGNFYEGTASAIINLKIDAGLYSANSDVTLDVMKALLSMDAFVCIPGGSTKIRSIQQFLNRTYQSYIGLMPCDGVYGRSTNTALIYALQAEEGLSTSVANGYFGPSTRRNCPTIDLSTDLLVKAKFMPIIQSALVCLGFDCELTNQYDTQTLAMLRLFQETYGIPVTNTINLTTWASLLTSCGDVERSAKACDCATILTPEKATTLKNKGYNIVGRYLTGYITDENGDDISKALTQSEIEIIFNAGLRFFPIYQTSANRKSYFSYLQGLSDGQNAARAAYLLDIPENTTIYFAVDYDATEDDMDVIIDHFQGIYNYFKTTCYRNYKIGIYASRNICTQVSNAGFATYSFVSDMSTGFSGNLGFPIPDNWSFDQFHTVTVGSGAGEIEIDKDGYSGRDVGVSTLQFSTPYSGVGNGHCMVNRSDKNIRVYRRRANIGDNVFVPKDEFDHIPPNGFFVYKDTWVLDSSRQEEIEGSTSPLDIAYPVTFTDSNGNLNYGYITDGNLATFPVENKEEVQLVWKKKDAFNLTRVDSNNNLVPNTAIEIDGNKYNQFTLSNDSKYYDSLGNYIGTLKKGTLIAVSGNNAGSKMPNLLYVDKVYTMLDEEAGYWQDLISRLNSGGFLDLRFDLGNKPENRLLR